MPAAKKQKPQSLATIAVHGGSPHREAGEPVALPLVQSVNFVQHANTAEGLRYTRYGNTPNKK